MSSSERLPASTRWAISRLAAASEQQQQLVDDPARCASLQEMAAAKTLALLIRLTRRNAFFALQAIDGSLHRGESGTARFGGRLPEPTSRTEHSPRLQESLHDLQFEFGMCF